MKKARPPRLLGTSPQKALDNLCKQHKVIGASLAVLKDGRIHTAVSGWANLPERIEVTPTTLFQIGSISKTFTATLAMQLVEEGLLDLDATVGTYLPNFATADPRAPEVTIRQLLTHTSGMEGDFFTPVEPLGSDSATYVAKLGQLGKLHEPGEYVTYCNSGYIVLTRIIEVLRKASWNDLVAERICKPLGLTHVLSNPLQALHFRMAAAHVLGKDGKWVLNPYTFMALSMAGAGTVLSMSATDLLRFAQAHMLGPHRKAAKNSILSQAGFRTMQAPQVQMSPYSRNDYTHMGMSWFLQPDRKYPKLNHDGATNQLAFLHILPKQRVAYALLVNCMSTTIGDVVRNAIFTDVAGIPAVNKPVVPSAIAIDPARYVGVYDGVAQAMTVTEGKAGHLQLEIRIKSAPKPQTLSLRAVAPDQFAILDKPQVDTGARILFLGDDNGHAKYCRNGARMTRWTGQASAGAKAAAT